MLDAGYWLMYDGIAQSVPPFLRGIKGVIYSLKFDTQCSSIIFNIAETAHRPVSTATATFVIPGSVINCLNNS